MAVQARPEGGDAGPGPQEIRDEIANDIALVSAQPLPAGANTRVSRLPDRDHAVGALRGRQSLAITMVPSVAALIASSVRPSTISRTMNRPSATSRTARFV